MTSGLCVSIDQAVILCGGLGTRLGQMTLDTPKPLLPVDARPFLDRLIFEIRRHGIRRFLLLAAYRSDSLLTFAREAAVAMDVVIEVAVEPGQCGTGGALWHARSKIDPVFYLFNGDSWFDLNLLDLALFADSSDCLVTLALRSISDASRYGIVTWDGIRVTSFNEKSPVSAPGLVNGGVYVVDRQMIDVLKPTGSFESELRELASSGRIAGKLYDGFFIDIGVPVDYERAQTEIPLRQRRGSIFFDRDGVLNEDLGYVGEIERFLWRPGAREAIKVANDNGLFVFVVTNQAGVARGYYSEDDVNALHSFMQRELRPIGAHIDDFRHCPFHEAGSVPQYTKACNWRKPGPGMLIDLMKNWPVDISQSILIGDKLSDILAGEAAGVRSVLIDDRPLDVQIRDLKQKTTA